MLPFVEEYVDDRASFPRGSKVPYDVIDATKACFNAIKIYKGPGS